MQIDRLNLKNFCQHADLQVEFPIGITGIVGPNGCGKSTIARALQFSLLGESGNAGTKLDDLNWLAVAAGGGTGTVELKFSKDGTKGTLKRAIQQARASLKFDTINVRSVSGTNSEIMKLLATSKQTLEDIVFVLQGQIERILFDRPAERKRNIHALFGIDKTEPIREVLRNEIGSLNLSPLDDRIAQLKSRIETEIDPKLREVDETTKKGNAELAGYDVTALKQIVADYEAAAQLRSHIATMEAELHRLTSQPAVDPAAMKQQLDTRKAAVMQQTDSVEAMRQKLASATTNKQILNTRDALTKELGELQATLTAPAPKAPDFDSSLLEKGKQQIEEAQAEIASKRAFVEAFEGKGNAVCPTCHQEVSNAGTLAESMKPQVAARQATIASVRAIVDSARDTLRKFEHEHTRYTDAVVQAATRKQTVESTLDGMPAAVQCDTQELADMDQAVNAFNVEVAELTTYEGQYNTVVTGKASQDAQVGSLNASIAQAKTQLVKQPAVEAHRSAKLTLDRVQLLAEGLAEATGRLKQLQEQRAGSLKELQSLEEQAKKAAGLKQYQSLCERTRTVLHYDNLPRLAMQRYLGVLNSKLNEFLSIFGVPFSCMLKNDLSVICNMPGVGEKPALRLSGGQKVMLGIAFRIAVYSMFASDLGFMVLDEPTAMLDEDKIASVATMLETVGAYARNANMQLIVITHEPELVRTFDHTIQL